MCTLRLLSLLHVCINRSRHLSRYYRFITETILHCRVRSRRQYKDTLWESHYTYFYRSLALQRPFTIFPWLVVQLRKTHPSAISCEWLITHWYGLVLYTYPGTKCWSIEMARLKHCSLFSLSLRSRLNTPYSYQWLARWSALASNFVKELEWSNLCYWSSYPYWLYTCTLTSL